MKPIVLTPGEPAGIGTELALTACAGRDDVVLIADPDLLTRRLALLRPMARYALPDRIECIDRLDATASAGAIRCWPVIMARASHPGQLDPANASYVLSCLKQAADFSLDGTARALVTGPLHKGIINDAGHPFSGHTEFLAAHSQTEQVVMMLATDRLRVALVTTHLPLRQVPDALTTQRLTTTLRILHAELQRKFHIAEPVIAVLGLNPHAGESGHLGHEEIEIITPVLQELRAAGLDLRGPLPADTAFVPSHLADFDAVCAMYHDQGLPVLKHAGFGHAVNVTLGLPYVRTSVDHGTALDLAGTGRADAGSLRAALELADRLAPDVRAPH